MLAVLLSSFFCLPAVLSLKILAFSPTAYHSHANFISKIADVLSEAGHEVVILSPVLHLTLPRKNSKHARYIYVENATIAREFTNYMDESMAYDLWTADNTDTSTIMQSFHDMMSFHARMCQVTAADRTLLHHLREEKFDVAYAETIDLCAFAVFHLAGITKYAVTESLSSMDGWEHVTGVPHFTSYVPGMLSSYSDTMTMYERAKNTYDAYLMRNAAKTIYGDMQAGVLAMHPNLPNFDDLLIRSSYFFVNTEPLIDFPHLVSRKMIDIGGISVPDKHKALAEPFSLWMSERPQTVLVSFGTLMLSSRMPSNFKESIVETARRLPNVTFIWKYEREEDNISAGVPNLHTATWVPQTDMLHDSRLSIFVTHGGLGSTNEATFSGVPVVALPVMADQMRNGQMIKRLGTGRLLHKDDLAEVDKFESAIREVLEDKKYLARAKKVVAMLAAQPQPVRERLISHFEFMGAFGPLDTLDHVGRDMGFVEFFNLDLAAIAFVALASAVVFSLVTVITFCKALSRVFGRVSIVKTKVQ